MTAWWNDSGKSCALAASLVAITLPCAAEAQQWDYGASIYVWASALDTSVETPFGTIETELSFGDILEKLDFALFATFEARNGPWVLMADINYTDLGTSRTTRGPVFSNVQMDSTLTILSAFGAYAVIDRPNLRLEAGGGLRYYDLTLETSADSNFPIIPDQRFNFSESWVDPIIGVHVRAPLSDRWFARGFADAGGFGIGDASELSWQIYAGGGYVINQTWAVEFGYRHLSIEKELERVTLTMEQSGPLIGLSARF